MPPSEQWVWVDGLGPNFSRWPASCRFSSSSTMPGSTTQVRLSTSRATSLVQYLVQSMTTAVLVHWPPRLVPPPRESTGASNSAQTAIASTPASTLYGTITARGTWR
jgi:hypothetical protein